MLAGIRFGLFRGWSAILAAATFPVLQTYTALPLWGIACIAALMIAGGLVVERRRYPRERLK